MLVLQQDVGEPPQQQRRVPEHRAQPDVPPAGRRERGLRQARHREPGQEAKGEKGRAGLAHHRHHHQWRSPQQVRHHPEDARWTAAGEQHRNSILPFQTESYTVSLQLNNTLLWIQFKC